MIKKKFLYTHKMGEENMPEQVEGELVTDTEVSEPTPENTKQPEKKTNAGSRIIIALIATAICGYLIYNALQKDKKQAPKEIPPRPVKTMIIKPENGNLVLKYPGSTRAVQQVDFSFKVSGSLIELTVNAGEVVKIGQVIARLDPRDYQNSYDARLANYLNAKARLERVRKLYQAAVDPKSKLDEAAALFKVAEAEMNIAKKSLDDCTLRATFDGVVAKRYVDNYQTVNIGEPIISLQDLRKLEIEVQLPEWLVAQAKNDRENAEAFAYYDSLPNIKIPLVIREFSAEADPTTRTYPVKFYMPNNPDTAHLNILPGMTANVTIIIKRDTSKSPIFALPIWAVNSDNANNKPYVYIVDDKSEPWVVHQQTVEVGNLLEDTIIVKKGLKEGQRIVTAGGPRLEDGQKVRDLPTYMQPTFSNSNEATEMGDKKEAPAASEMGDM